MDRYLLCAALFMGSLVLRGDGCGGPGGSSTSGSDGPACQNFVNAEDAASVHGERACGFAATMDDSFVPPCQQKCASSSDQSIIEAAATCLNGLPACSAYNEESWATQAEACTAPFANLSAGCIFYTGSDQ